MSDSPVGLFISTATPPQEIGGLARQAEDLGLAEVWVAEDYFCYGGFTAAGLALAATRQVKVGIGIVAAVARHPAVAAMEIATLACAYPDRLLPGIGHGVPFWTDQMGLTPKSPLSALTETVNGIRDLLAGETVDAEGRQFVFNSVTLTHTPAAPVPLLTGVLGPKSLRLSGKIADGTVMSVLSGTKYLENAMGHIKGGMDESGRTSHSVPTFAIFGIDRDGKAAKTAVRPTLAFYIAAVGPHNPLTAAFGYNDQIADILSRGGADLLVREMPDEWVDELTVAGDPDEVAERINRLRSAGATSVVLSPVNKERAAADLALCAEAVLPQID